MYKIVIGLLGASTVKRYMILDCKDNVLKCRGLIVSTYHSLGELLKEAEETIAKGSWLYPSQVWLGTNITYDLLFEFDKLEDLMNIRYEHPEYFI